MPAGSEPFSADKRSQNETQRGERKCPLHKEVILSFEYQLVFITVNYGELTLHRQGRKIFALDEEGRPMLQDISSRRTVILINNACK